jgi:hypothetical protein
MGSAARVTSAAEGLRAVGYHAVRLVTRIFRDPAPDGYNETRDFAATEQIVPLFAPQPFALCVDELRRTSARRDKGRANS